MEKGYLNKVTSDFLEAMENIHQKTQDKLPWSLQDKRVHDFKISYPITDPIEFLEAYLRAFPLNKKVKAYFPVPEKHRFKEDTYKGIPLFFDEKITPGNFHITFDE